MGSDDRLTPARRQYLALKRRHPDALLLYRMGDFYELFDDDAVVAARDLHITLTSREFGKGNRVPMAGVPHHALASYLRRLLAKGHRVAIGEQLSEPGHGLVERDVVRVLSPGTVVEPGLLAARENNYLLALNPGRDATGLAYVDVSTGEFAMTQFASGEEAALAAELARLAAAECLMPEGVGSRESGGATRDESPIPDSRLPTPACPITECPARWFRPEPARERLLRHFGVASLEPFGCEGLPLATGAAAAALAYVESTNRDLARLLRGLRAYTTGEFVTLDPATRRNLELTRAARSGERAGSLLAALDHTRTAMGGRLLRRWLNRPLRDIAAINRRLDTVAALTHDHDRRGALLAALECTGDIERLAARARQAIATPRDLRHLAAGLRAAGEIGGILAQPPALAPGRVASAPSGEGSFTTGIQPEPNFPLPLREGGLQGVGPLDPAPDIADLIERAIADEDGHVIRAGFDGELDELTATVGAAQQTLVEMERRERERTGIRSLKVGFNKVFGYYIEVSKAGLKHVPADFIRRQTLANGERFVTPELKEWEARILRAEERIEERRDQVLTAVLEQVGGEVGRLLATAAAVAELDVLANFADLAVQRRYVRPVLDPSTVLEIGAGRHPVVELALEDGAFVANDTILEDLSPPPPSLKGTGSPGRDVPDCSDLVQDVAGDDHSRFPSPFKEGGQGGRSASEEVEQGKSARLLLITGPNMAGKSTYLRQVALIALLAHVGCFVPAGRARIGIVDRIFTRVGAQDDLAAGASTFLVEMIETAAILRLATERSLLVFDEIGRGTSTFDGLSIAQAVVEDAHDRICARTLFATHYHELTALAERLPGLRNYNVAAAEEAGRIVFLRRLVPGGADRSYGIHVARLAGLPEHVTTRATALLAELEAGRQEAAATGPGSPHPLPPPPTLEAGDGPSPARTVPHGAAHLSVPVVAEEPTPPTAGAGAHAEPGLSSSGIGAPAPGRPGAVGAGLPDPARRIADATLDRCLVCELEQRDALLDELRRLNLAATTPMQALNLLFTLQEQLTAPQTQACEHAPRRPRLAVIEPPSLPEPHRDGTAGGRHPREAGRGHPGLMPYLRRRGGPIGPSRSSDAAP